MTFQEFLRSVPRGAAIYREVGESNALTVSKHSANTIDFHKHRDRVSAHTASVLAMTRNSAELTELMCMSRAIADGPKVFRPGQVDLEALEHTDLTLPLRSYVQPFPTVVVEFPPEYAHRRTVGEPYTGLSHSPLFVVLHHMPDVGCLMTTTAFSSKSAISNVLTETDQDIEDLLRSVEAGVNKGNVVCSDEELRLNIDTLRAAVNFCLLIEEVGMKKQRDVGNLERQLKERLKTLRKQRRDTAATEKQLASLPVYYELDQRVELWKRSGSSGSEEAAGRTVKPHHRRGHWRLCASGKRVRVSPCFINKHMFLGAGADAAATYE